MRRIATATALALMAACTPSAPQRTPAEAAAHALTLTPKDARLADLYAQSCKTCHTVLDTSAPLTGDRDAWDARWKKGKPALLTSTVGGLGGMPAGGQCFSCTPADYEALIAFMADREH
ncbi:MAG: c-type cytochrome [Alphaproteobacteria bacterium]|nr:c-type cytochrome [Alphaproteobacteria bacterium]